MRCGAMQMAVLAALDTENGNARASGEDPGVVCRHLRRSYPRNAERPG